MVRSHPGESLKGWQKDLVNFKNIEYIKPSESIDPYIFACSGFFHRGTTTAYQAILAKKPISFIYLDRHVRELHLYKENLMKEATIVKNTKDFLLWSKKALNREINQKNANIKISKKIKKELNLQKNFSSKIIIEKIDSLKCKKEQKMNYNFAEITFKDEIKNKTKNSIRKILSHIFLKEKTIFNELKVKKLDKGIQSKEIKDTIKRLNKLLKLNIKSKIYVTQISDNVVELEI